MIKQLLPDVSSSQLTFILTFCCSTIVGLDAAAAENIMQEIVRVAKEERIIILCTIHQPSTKVYNGFDETMIMSRARTAYIGDVQEAVPYFERIGFPLPPQTNPAGRFPLPDVILTEPTIC
jgi:ABC-type multidrug transport system ATPase subunit